MSNIDSIKRQNFQKAVSKGTMALMFIAALALFATPSQLVAKEELSEQEQKFKDLLTNSKLIGTFTIDGMDGKPREEEYTIGRVRKHEDKDAWVLWARINYSKNNYAVPLKLNVKWAGKTPMITLDDFEILGQGPFGARVLFHNNKYCGTWSHGKVGGHMFGRIEKIKKEDADKTTSEADKKDVQEGKKADKK